MSGCTLVKNVTLAASRKSRYLTHTSRCCSFIVISMTHTKNFGPFKLQYFTTDPEDDNLIGKDN